MNLIIYMLWLWIYFYIRLMNNKNLEKQAKTQFPHYR